MLGTNKDKNLTAWEQRKAKQIGRETLLMANL